MTVLRKKLVAAVMLLGMIFSSLALAGCANKETTYTTFPEKFILAGTDVGGMTADEAKEAVAKTFETYSLDLSLNGYDFKVSAVELGIEVNEEFDYDTVIQAANKDEASDTTGMVLCADEKALEDVIKNYLGTAISDKVAEEMSNKTEGEESEPSEAEKALSYVECTNLPYITYDSESEKFIAVDGPACDAYDFGDAIEAIKAAIEAGGTVVSTEAPVVTKEGVKVSEDETIEQDLASANEYLDLQLGILFELKGYKTNQTDISKKELAGFLSVQNDGRTVVIAEDALASYCGDISKAHNKSKWRSKNFQTTNSGVIKITVPVAGVEVDANQLYADIATAIEGKESTVVKAVYTNVESDSSESVDFGGQYVELDLTNQRVYVYNHGKLQVETPVVTGCVVRGWRTPAGVYHIFTHDKNRYLNGPGYHSWVNFFCAFNGGIGFHDASWRSDYGSSVYLYSGSHGCVNMPYKAAKILYENVKIGTTVVAYGGVTSVDKLEQEWRGKDEYTVKIDHDDLDFGNRAKHGTPTYSYKSTNKKVATVDKNGIVKIQGAGTCQIVIHSTATDKWKFGEHIITLNVNKLSSKLTASVDNTSLGLAPGESGSATVSASVTSNSKLGYSITSCNSDLVTATISASGEVSVTAADASAFAEYTEPVTVKLTITINSEATAKYAEASKKLTITVTVTP